MEARRSRCGPAATKPGLRAIASSSSSRLRRRSSGLPAPTRAARCSAPAACCASWTGHRAISGLSAPVDIATAPAYPIRGHQLGYRAQANSYDAWDAAQFEQYIRELTFFGANSIEGIPFQDYAAHPGHEGLAGAR